MEYITSESTDTQGNSLIPHRTYRQKIARNRGTTMEFDNPDKA